MRFLSLLETLRASDKRARSQAARQRLIDDLFPALAVTRLEERRLLNAAPVVVTPAPTLQETAVDASVAPDAPEHDEAGSDINDLAVTMYGGPAKGDFTPEMDSQLQSLDATAPLAADTSAAESAVTSDEPVADQQPIVAVQSFTGFSQPTNMPPVNVVPGAQFTNEDSPLVISGISVSDADSGAFPVTTQFTVAHGTLSVDTTGGVVQPSGAILMPDGTVITGNGTNTLTMVGATGQISSHLTAGLTYTPGANFAGSDLLTMTTNDLGAFGAGGPQQDIDTVAITVFDVNDPPVNVVPGSQSTNEDTPLVISGISVSDADASLSPITTLLTVNHGTLTVDTTGGLPPVGAAILMPDGTIILGNGTNALTIIGTTTQITNELSLGLTYAPAANYYGSDQLTVTSSDLGAFGIGGPLQDIDTVAISVLSVNDPPVNTVPGPQQTNEDTPLVIGGIAVSDIDASPFPITTQLSVGHATLTVDTTGGVPQGGGVILMPDGTIITGNGTNTLTLVGTTAQISDELALGLTYTPDANFYGSDQLKVTTNDLGAFGAGGPLQDIDTVAISVLAVNDPPVNTVPGPQQTNEDTPLVISGIAVSDVDASPSPITTQFTVGHGTLTVDTTGGVPQGGGVILMPDGMIITGNGTNTLILVGTTAQISNELALGLTYTPAANYNGSDQLKMTSNDLGAFGAGGPLQDIDFVDISVLAVNDPPVNTVPGPQQTNEDTPLVINGIAVSDIDSGASPISTQLSVSHGTLSVDTTGGIPQGGGVILMPDGTIITGNGTNTLTIVGTTAQISNELALGLTYTPDVNFFGSDQLQVLTNDLGAFGAGGPLQDTDVVAITVLAVNDPPVNTVPGPQQTNEDTPLVISGIAVSDVDSGASPISTQLSVSHGTLSVDTTGGIPQGGGAILMPDGTIITGNGTNTLILVGTTAQISNELALGLTYTPAANYNGSDQLKMTSNDLGAFGAGGPLQDIDFVDISVLAVNDPPVNTVSGPQQTNEDTPLVISGIAVSDIDSGASPISTQLSVSHGTLSVDTTGGIPQGGGVILMPDGTIITGNGTNTLTIVGTTAQISNELALGLTYAPDANYNGSDQLKVVSNDLGAFGAGGPQQDIDTVDITVIAVNDPPVNTVIGPQTTNEDTPLPISGMAVSDIDSGSSPITTLFTVSHGTLSVDTTGGVPQGGGVILLPDGTIITGNGTNTLTIVGTTAQINQELSLGLTYTPSSNYSGADLITMTTNDLGATGLGGPLQDVDTIAITVVPVADVPTLIIGAPAVTGNEGSPIPLNISGQLNDTDGSEVLTFTIAGVPTTGVLHDGLGIDHTGQSTYTFSVAEINGMTLTMPDDTGNQNFTLTVTAIATEQANGSTATSQGTINVTINNVPPTLSNLAATNTNEGSATTLTGVISDPGTDTFTVVVNWGDGHIETYTNVPRGAFTYTHVYVDDNPTGTPSDTYHVHVDVTDDDGGTTAGDTTLIVSNVAPTITNIQAPTINEGQTASLTFTVNDVGTADTFQITIDWKDGTAPTILNNQPTGTYTVTHLYVDNAPGIQPYQVSITALDDDTGLTTVTTNLLVQDVAPTVSLVAITPTELNEGSTATFTGTFSDPGINDSFTIVIQWGDGTSSGPINMPAGSNSFSATHFYFDDNPSGTSTDLNHVVVTITDKDGLSGVNSTNIRVDNVAPTLTGFINTNVGSNGVVTISGVVADISTNDVLTLTINWVSETQVVTLPQGAFEISHFYNQSPNADPSAPITIQVTLSDDDLGTVSTQGTAAVPGLGAGGGDMVFFYVEQTNNTKPLGGGGEHIDIPPAAPTALVFNTVQFDMHGDRGDGFAAAKPVVSLRTFDPVTGTERGVVILPVDVLNNLTGLFARLPDDHYRLYYVEQGTERMIMDVVVRRGKPIDPNDESEGTQDRPPTARFEDQPAQQQIVNEEGAVDEPVAAEAPEQNPAPVNAQPEEPNPADSGRLTPAEELSEQLAAVPLPGATATAAAEENLVQEKIARATTNRYRELMLPAAAALVASSGWSGGRWARAVDRELAQAPQDALSKAARLRRRLRRSLNDRTPNGNRSPD